MASSNQDERFLATGVLDMAARVSHDDDVGNLARTQEFTPWVLKHNGIVYHYYCAVGLQGRVIALATSRDVRSSDRGK